MLIEGYEVTVLEDHNTRKIRGRGKKASRGNKRVRHRKEPIIEQLLPDLHDASCSQTRYRTGTVSRETWAGDLDVLLVLEPHETEFARRDMPLEQSIARFSSRNGDVNVEIWRITGAEDHSVQTHLTSFAGNVSVLLPRDFRGAIYIGGPKTLQGRIKFGPEFYRRMTKGFITLNPSRAREGEDEIHIDALGEIELRLDTWEPPSSPWMTVADPGIWDFPSGEWILEEDYDYWSPTRHGTGRGFKRLARALMFK